jgi:hypothetical protein
MSYLCREEASPALHQTRSFLLGVKSDKSEVMAVSVHPYFPEPTDEQREALAIAGTYLERAAIQAATRLMSHSIKGPNQVIITEMHEGMKRSARLCQMVVEIFDGWPSEFTPGN